MPSTPLATAKEQTNETVLFLKRWLKHPLRLGAIAPSSNSLAEMIAKQVVLNPNHYVVELGAGTGTLTRKLMEYGIPNDRLFVIELDPELYTFLSDTHPNANIIQGNASDLDKLLPADCVGRVSTIVSGLPISTMSFKLQKSIIDAALSVLAPEGGIIQYSYRHNSPIPVERLGLSKEKIGVTFRNIPPATVWRFKNNKTSLAKESA
jgi:phosphatidylethanolamine/phosphatidyl-N-methylethanolamine N-methyltransferase